ncbi:MAG TPA: DUF1326 domain-containing protein [Alphaproteobacteria bacterium]
MASWSIEGQYFETCNCAYLCPCIGSNLTARPTEGDCKAAMAMKVERGQKDGVKLDGLAFIVLLHAPTAMADGNFTVGLIVDTEADEKQRDAIAAIASGAAGGPMAHLAPLVGRMAGIERRPIRFEQDGMRYSVTAGDLVAQSCEGVPGPARPGEPIYLDNTGHPANQRLALAKAKNSRFHAFGIDWEDASGTRNGHFAPFNWSG